MRSSARRVDRNHPVISFNSTLLKFCDKISMMGLNLRSEFYWNDHIISAAKADECKLSFLFRTKRFFKPTQLLSLYKTQIRHYLEYGSHLWRGTSKQSLATLNAIQRRVIRLIEEIPPYLARSILWLILEPSPLYS